MKRKISLFTVMLLMMSLCLTGCGGSDRTAEIAGYYKCTSIYNDGEEYEEYAELAKLGIYEYMVFNEDGTGYTEEMGEKRTLNWDDGHIWDDDSAKSPFTYENGVVTIGGEGADNRIIYEKLAGAELDDYIANGAPDWEELMEKAFMGSSTETGTYADYDSESYGYNDFTGEDAEFGDVLSNIETTIAYLSGSYDDSAYASLNGSADGYAEAVDTSSGSHEDAGYYEIVSYEEYGEQYHRTVLEEAGITFDMMLYEDGTGYAHFMGDYYDLTWEDGTLYVDTYDGIETLTYTTAYLGRTHIYIEDDVSMMTFEYSGEAY